MSEPYVGEIRIFAGNFAPAGWSFCDGAELPIAQNQALFSLLGNTYGGDGQSTFGLPDLRGRAPMHGGTGPGLSPRPQGQMGGSETVALTEGQLPSHQHPTVVAEADADRRDPDGALPAWTVGEDTYGTPDGTIPNATSPTGGGQAHNNMQPYLALNFIIARVGLFPSPS